MSTSPGFEAYLISKKIDSDAFRNAEPEMWNAWKKDFEQIHPNSFTLQKLNLLNPVRRKYMIRITTEPKPETPSAVPAAPAAPKPAKPVMRPKID
jgi:hypothetical protein